MGYKKKRVENTNIFFLVEIQLPPKSSWVKLPPTHYFFTRRVLNTHLFSLAGKWKRNQPDVFSVTFPTLFLQPVLPVRATQSRILCFLLTDWLVFLKGRL